MIHSRSLIRNMATLVGLLILLCLERVWGLPLLFLAASWLWVVAQKSFESQVMMIVTLGVVLAVVYVLPVTVAVGIMMAGGALVMRAHSAAKNPLGRLYVSVIGSSLVIGWWTSWDFTLLSGVIVLFDLAVMIGLSRTLVVLEQHQAGGGRLKWKKNYETSL